MHKIIVLTLLVLSMVQLASTTTCSAFPILQKIKDYINIADPNNELTDARAKLDAYPTTEASVQNDLGPCSQFNGESTCCSTEFVNSVVKGAVKAFFKQTKGKKPTQLKMMDKLGQAIAKCSGKPAKDDMDGEAGFEKGKQFAFKVKKCQAESLKAKIKFDRGNLCSLCIDPTKYAEYFDENNQLILTEASATAYKAAAAKGLKCLDDAQAEFKTMADAAIEAFGDSTKCSKLKEKITEVLNAPANKPCGGETCETKVGSEMEAFGEGIQDQIEGPDPSLDVPARRRNLKSERRVLATGITTSSTGGLVTFIADSDDDDMNIDGVDEKSEYDDEDGNSSSVLVFSGVLSVAIMLFALF